MPPATPSHAAHVPVREIGIVVALALAVFLLLSLGSYSPWDSSITYASTDATVRNLAGNVGAVAADILFLAFGWAAYLLPVALAAAAVRMLRRRLVEHWSWAGLLTRAGGIAIALLGICVLTRLHFSAGAGLPAGNGGALGASIVQVGLPALNWAGLTLCALVCIVIGSQAAIGFSWLVVAERIGKVVLTLAGQVGESRRRRRGAVRDARVASEKRAAPEPEPAVEPHAAAEPKPSARQRRGAVLAGLWRKLAPRDAKPATRTRRREMRGRNPAETPSARRIEPGVGTLAPVVPAAPAVRVAPIVGDAPAVSAEPVAPEPTPMPLAENGAPPDEIGDEPPMPPARDEGVHAADGAVAAEDEPLAALPSFDLLEEADPVIGGYSEESLLAMSRLLEERLKEFKVVARVEAVQPGPVVTRFEVQPAPGVRGSQISGLAMDLARSLKVKSVRVVEIIPGKSVVGIEIPNARREMVRLKEILDSAAYRDSESLLTLVLGKDVGGVPTVADVAGMPHLLVAGTTGSGKSVGINAMLLSMLYKATPEELRLILVDPKVLELSVYDGIPHLLTPVVTDMKDAAQALNWCAAEMDRRYKAMAALGVRNLAGYNRRIDAARAGGEPLRDPLWPAHRSEPAPPLARLPTIVVVIDELADMMMVVQKKVVEQLIARIAQKARAAGIHLVLATQRPSADVITGLIKANIPSRIAFQVSSRIDSRVILDQGGAEQLLGHGDMLFLGPGTSASVRVHGAFVSDEEVHAVVADWKRRGAPEYVAEVLAGPAEEAAGEEAGGDAETDDPMYDQAVEFVVESRRASISAVQRKLRIGYNRAARIIESMEQAGLVSPMNGTGGRDVLVPRRGDG